MGRGKSWYQTRRIQQLKQLQKLKDMPRMLRERKIIKTETMIKEILITPLSSTFLKNSLLIVAATHTVSFNSYPHLKKKKKKKYFSYFLLQYLIIFSPSVISICNTFTLLRRHKCGCYYLSYNEIILKK